MGYDSPYGTGDRRSDITVSNTVNVCIYHDINYFVNGVIVGDNSLWLYPEDITGKYLRFQFPEAIIVDHIKWYQTDDGSHTTHGTWKIQGSCDGSSWDDVGDSFTLGVSDAQEIDISANTIAYTYYQIIGVSGTAYPNHWILEAEFSWAYPSYIKSVNGIDYADIKSVDIVAVAGIKKIN
jgi:hypothetical protein